MKHLSLVLIVAVALGFAACSDSDNATSASQTASDVDMDVQSRSELDDDVSTNSSVKSSSSSVAIPASSSDIISGLTGNYLTDSRDGQIYKTVSIGSQTWMAQNLNYETANSYCYNDSAKYCSKYGRLYTWAAAMDSVGIWSTNGKGCGYDGSCSPIYPVHGVCPSGWHLPSEDEFKTLFTAVDGWSYGSYVGKKLKSTSGWSDWEYYGVKSGNGSNDYSFSALPAGFRNDNDEYKCEGEAARFWSSTQDYVYLTNVGDNSGLSIAHKGNGFSVRCVKD